MSDRELHLLCAGAARGLVGALRDEFMRSTGARIQASFGAVGTMKEALEDGSRCDVMVVTAAMVASLQAAGLLEAGTSVDLGRVRTGVGVRVADPHPDVRSTATLRGALLAAPAIYFPDPMRSTAGIHFASVLRELGIADAVVARCRTFPNGAAAMRELAASGLAGALGCTQVTEILDTPGIELVGALPATFELATAYTAAIGAHARHPMLAEQFIATITGPASRALRLRCGFELDDDLP